MTLKFCMYSAVLQFYSILVTIKLAANQLPSKKCANIKRVRFKRIKLNISLIKRRYLLTELAF